jgi:hypothetical protein
MLDPNDAILSCADSERMVGAIDRVMPLLAADVRRRLNFIKLHYVMAYGQRGLYDRVNGRTVTEVLAEYREPAGPEVIAERERDGVRFTLYDDVSWNGSWRVFYPCVADAAARASCESEARVSGSPGRCARWRVGLV